ncbi:MAG TPA: SRPBCC domain-containing protein [Phycisphaerae bacterium]|nr:SRPBCC domain-containing protein [Phycisphaerae bacterium]HRW54002.1 SRPBCC domain-containing protein [Phycisphaerae bacterium]
MGHPRVVTILLGATALLITGSISLPPVPTEEADANAPLCVGMTINASPEEAFDLWTTTYGVKQFWAADAIIEPEVGGRYYLMFNDPENPEDAIRFMHETKVREIDCGRSLAIDFRMFTWNRGLPTRSDVAPPTLLRIDAGGSGIVEREEFRGSWVELRFDTAESDMTKTRIQLTHHQLEETPHARLFAKFYWLNVLGKMQRHCAEEAVDVEAGS